MGNMCVPINDRSLYEETGFIFFSGCLCHARIFLVETAVMLMNESTATQSPLIKAFIVSEVHGCRALMDQVK